jgi:hypothetical protein
MPSILDAAVMVGLESTYGTAVTPTRAYEAKADTWKRENQYLESVGMRASMQTARSDRRRAIQMGGAGALSLDVMDRGMGLLLNGVLGTTTGPTLLTGTAYSQAHATSSDSPLKSYTFQVIRPGVDGVNKTFTYHGCTVTGFQMEQGLEGFLTLSLDFDFQEEEDTTSAGTPTYPTGALPWDWSQAVVTVDAVALDVKGFTLSGDLGMNTSRRYLRGDWRKKQPRRSAVPSYEGSLTTDYDTAAHAALLTKYRSGATSTLAIKWTGATINAPHAFEFEVSVPVVQWNGGTPEAKMDDLTALELPFRVLHGASAAVTVNIKSTDSAL